MFSQYEQVTGGAGRDFAPSDYVPPSVMMYSDDIFGLGHLRRNTTIASRFVREVPGSSVLMLTGLPSGCFFEVPDGVDFIKLPSVSKVDTGIYETRTLHVSQNTMKSLRAAIIEKAARLFNPDILLVDHMPVGIWGELLPTLQMLKAQRNPPMIVLGLRDILDAPTVTRRLWQANGVYEAITQYYDSVLIYGCQKVFDTSALYGLEDGLASKVNYCGYLCAEDSYQSRNEVREMLQLADRKFVVVTAGGGHDAYRMMESCMAAVRLMASEMNLHALFITGPLMDRQHREDLTKQSLGLPIQVISHVTDPLSYMNAADLVLTMAGYNSLIEAIHLRKKTLVIPRQGPSAEQRLRTEIFARLGLVQAVDPRRATPPDLARCIVESLNAGAVAKPLLPMDGLENTVRRMTSLLARRWSSQVAAMA